jgi:hypothetical protein
MSEGEIVRAYKQAAKKQGRWLDIIVHSTRQKVMNEG